MSSDSMPAVIAGIDSMQGLQAARILAARGVKVYATAKHSGHHSTRTRSVHRVLVATSDDQLVSELIKLGDEIGPAALFPCTDGLVRLVSKHRDALSRHFRFVLPSHDIVEVLLDKDRFYAHAARAGFPVPWSKTVADAAEFESAVAQATYPCVLKPPYRSAIWSANTVDKGFLATGPEELRAHYERCREWSDQLIVQQWVPGGPDALFSCNLYVTRSGEVAVTFVARKLRQWPIETGQSSLGEECRHDDVLALATDLFKQMGYKGLAYAEIKQAADDGRLYIIEPNIGRPTGRSAIAEAGGVELLYTAYCDAAGLPLPEARVQSYGNVKWIHLRRDFQSALVSWRRGELSLRGWMRSLRGRKVYAVFSWRDPVPFVVDLWEALRTLVRGRRFR